MTRGAFSWGIGEMIEGRSKDPLHGKTLKAILSELVERYGWEELSARIRINCFADNPSLNSSLKFLRKTPWARAKVEAVYLETHGYPAPLRAGKRSASGKKEDRSEAGRTPRVNVWTGKPFDDAGKAPDR